MSFSEDYLAEVQQVAGDLDTRMIERLAFLLAQVRSSAGGFSFSEWAEAPPMPRTP